MLQLSKISIHKPYTDQWFAARLGMLTSSKISCLCGERGIGEGGMTYIRNKVYEKITGKTSEKDVMTEATTWGNLNEPIAIKEYQQVYEVPSIITDKHIIYDDLYSSTPDGLLFMDAKFSMSADQLTLNCETLESKSYMTPSVHMAHVECVTPADIKALNKPLYFQVLSQMLFADVTRGNACFFHPDFPKTSKYRLGRVHFSKLDHVDVRKDMGLLKERIELARTIFNQKLQYSKQN